jgi:2-succinyl-5-enolpyruvyl-6-hydroxy-3-cyclohexene-1-carboxylate synthase
VEQDDRRGHADIMTAPDAHVLLRAFCQELARCGVGHAATAPGSRSAPLVLALVREGRLRCWTHVDERCAGFFALGVAKATGTPAVVACTSGTAAANLAPAVHEAHQARVPLLVLTADRPPELRDVGAGQVIDQVKLFGTAAKWSFEVGTHEASPDRVRWIRALACRAHATALEGRSGVVHLNFALREPLVPPDPLSGDDTARPGGVPYVVRNVPHPNPRPDDTERLSALVDAHPRGVLVCGRVETAPGLAEAVAGLAETTGYPVLADPLSGARRGPAAVAHYDALLRDPQFACAHRPDLVLRVGDLPTSKPLRAWLAGACDAVQVALDPQAAWQDPDAAVQLSLAADPASTLAELVERCGGAPDAAWGQTWSRADQCAAGAIATTLGDALSEPRVAAELGTRLAPGATLVVASSMPVRDVETFWAARDGPPRVLSNRGANGIDGTLSTAFGAAAAGGPVTVLIGDVALAHDVGGLLAASRLGLDLTVVLLNNDGGGIFHFLPVATQTDAFEEHVATPHGLDFAHAAALYRCTHVLARNLAQLREALDAADDSPGTTIVEVRTDREANLALHRRVWDAVSAAVREGGGGPR